jgi:hypothetical protein
MLQQVVEHGGVVGDVGASATMVSEGDTSNVRTEAMGASVGAEAVGASIAEAWGWVNGPCHTLPRRLGLVLAKDEAMALSTSMLAEARSGVSQNGPAASENVRNAASSWAVAHADSIPDGKGKGG